MSFTSSSSFVESEGGSVSLLNRLSTSHPVAFSLLRSLCFRYCDCMMVAMMVQELLAQRLTSPSVKVWLDRNLSMSSRKMTVLGAGCWLLLRSRSISSSSRGYQRGASGQWARIVSNARRVFPDMDGPSMRTGMPLLRCSTSWC